MNRWMGPLACLIPATANVGFSAFPRLCTSACTAQPDRSSSPIIIFIHSLDLLLTTCFARHFFVFLLLHCHPLCSLKGILIPILPGSSLASASPSCTNRLHAFQLHPLLDRPRPRRQPRTAPRPPRPPSSSSNSILLVSLAKTPSPPSRSFFDVTLSTAAKPVNRARISCFIL